MISAVALVILGPTVWKKALLHSAGSAPFPYETPALFTVLDRSQAARNEAKAYESQYIRSETGLGAAGTSMH